MNNRFIGSLFILLTSVFILAGESYAQADCTRAAPTRVVRKSVFPKTAFVLNFEKNVATETVEFSNGDKLTITNSGCEYFNLDFRFETKRFSARANDVKYWYKQSVKLIKQTQKGIKAPIRMAESVKALEKYLRKTKKLRFGAEVDYGESEIRTFVVIDKIKKLPGKKVFIEINFSVGPL